MLHFGTYKSYDDDDEDDDIYGIEDDEQQTDNDSINLKKHNMMNRNPHDTWFITLLNKSNNKETYINFSQIVSVNFEKEKNPTSQDTSTFSCESIELWLIIATPIGVYKCQMDYQGWVTCASFFKGNSFSSLYERPISCRNIVFKSN